MLDLMIVSPTAHAQIYQGLSSEYAAIEPPIWAAMLAASCLKGGFTTELVDCEGEFIGYQDVAKRVADLSPKLVAVVVYGQQPSASTQNMHGASLTLDAIKALVPDQKVILIGGHVSALPRQTLEEENVDFVCQGEGIFTLKGLLGTDMRRPDLLRKVPGLWFKDDLGQVVNTAPAAMVAMDVLEQELPGLAYSLLPMQNYRAHNWHCYDNITDRGGYASLYTSLGCPFTCSFCCINAPFGANRFRYWQPEFIVSQIDMLVEKFGVKNLKIADEMFVLKEPHFMEICRLLEQRDYQLNIWAYSRVDTVKERHLEQLKRAGVNWLGLGIESVSAKVRDDVIKGKFKADRISEVVDSIQSADIHVAGNFIFGLPEDDLSSMKFNLDYAMSLNLDMANFYSAMAYPGSKLYREAIDKKWSLPETWLGYSQHAYECLPLPTNHIGADQVLAFRDKAWQAFHTNPGFLNRMQRKFGDNVHRHLKDMTNYILPRKYAAPKLNQEFSYSHFDSSTYIIPTEKKVA